MFDKAEVLVNTLSKKGGPLNNMIDKAEMYMKKLK